MPELRIDLMRVHLVEIPARVTHSHGSGDVAGVRSAVLELVTEDGITGWGEASPWPVFTGTLEGNAHALHTHLRSHVVGADARQVSALLATADRVLLGHGDAKAALETALLDIVGQASGLSVSELVGGRHRDRIPLSMSIANPDFDANLEDVDQAFEDGVRIFKLKAGFAGHGFDTMRLEALRERYGDTIDLRVDYNQGLAAHDAIRTLRDIEAFRPGFIEQPVKRHEREALAAITRTLDTPVMADESVFDPAEALIGAQMRIADIFALKVMKAGGIRRALEVAAIGQAAGIASYAGCMFETGIAHAAGTHMAAAVSDLALGCEFYMPTYYLTDDLLAEPFPVRDGHVHVPTGPGLSVTVDPDKLAVHRTHLLE